MRNSFKNLNVRKFKYLNQFPEANIIRYINKTKLKRNNKKIPFLCFSRHEPLFNKVSRRMKYFINKFEISITFRNFIIKIHSKIDKI